LGVSDLVGIVLLPRLRKLTQLAAVALDERVEALVEPDVDGA